MKRTLATAAALAALSMPLWGRAPETSVQLADLAWARGDYVAALTAYLQILDSSDAAGAFDAIALQTGELYQTTELTANGSAPAFSPDGRYVSYETGSGIDRLTRILRPDGTTPVAEVRGFAAAFSVDGSRVAYLRLERAADLPAPRLRLVVHDLASARDTTIDTGSIRPTSLAYGTRAIFFAGVAAEGGEQIYEVAEGGLPVPRTTGSDKMLLKMNPAGTALLFADRPAGGRGGGRGSATGGATPGFGVLSLADGRTTLVAGSSPSFSRDGASLAYIGRDGAANRVLVAPVADPARASIVHSGPERLDAPALSPDGARVAFQMMPHDDWEIYVANRDGSGETRLTREIQHDIMPQFLSADRVLAAIGEPRHRRSYLYDLAGPTRTRLFHNNTVRTIAPEYSWTVNRDGTRVLIAAERDGDTVSPERGVYLMDLTRRVTRDALRARVEASLAAEQSLAARGRKMYRPIAAEVARVVDRASIDRIYSYEKRLFDFDSKHVTQPGNKLAATFLYDTYRSFGDAPEYQPFAYRLRNGPTGQTANVVATLRGTVNPELIYVVSSHYDSVAVGPGADDDSSGTAALLEAARILAGHPQPATIVFASFTGEEEGLLGSREFVRRAVAGKLHVVGALNNDMIGWANDARLDNTIRYSNAGIRDVQHAAAMQFSRLITYDALYYKSTDAAAYYEAYGDIVGGIGSYPVLGNPHYHQAHDLLDGINHQLVTEVSKTTAATLMLLASSPSRIKDLKVDSFTGGRATVSWTPSPEKGITGYVVMYGPPSRRDEKQLRVVSATATLTGVAPGTAIAVKAINAKGLEGWDWARAIVP